MDHDDLFSSDPSAAHSAKNATAPGLPNQPQDRSEENLMVDACPVGRTDRETAALLWSGARTTRPARGLLSTSPSLLRIAIASLMTGVLTPHSSASSRVDGRR